MQEYQKTFEDLFEMVQNHEPAPSWALGLKLPEEVGEFSEVLLRDLGYLKHKEGKAYETLFEEGADIINVVCGIIAKEHPGKHPQELADQLLAAINKKGAKYARLMNADGYFDE